MLVFLEVDVWGVWDEIRRELLNELFVETFGKIGELPSFLFKTLCLPPNLIDRGKRLVVLSRQI
jgi:hypothetical protein